jgi:hypothetical protein
MLIWCVVLLPVVVKGTTPIKLVFGSGSVASVYFWASRIRIRIYKSRGRYGSGSACQGSPTLQKTSINILKLTYLFMAGMKTAKGTKQLKLDPSIYESLQKVKEH